MNKIIKYLILAAAALAGLNACNQENERAFYDESAPAAYTFLQKNVVAELSNDDNGMLSTVIARTRATEAASLQLLFTATDAVQEIFTFPAPTVSFAAGVYEVTLNIPFAFDKLSLTGQYEFSVEFADPETPISIGGNEKTTIKAGRKLTFIKVGAGTFTSNYVFGETFDDKVIERAVELPTLYRARDLYANDYHILIQVYPDENRAVIPVQELGLQVFTGYTRTWLRADACTFVNGVITVTPGSATNWNRWTVEPPPSTLGLWVTDTEILALPAGSY
ncbi:MAG: hypothetical protein LBG31_03705 [Prevotellaceae bacterium]|jgi:hypothetical protein|nr:hypothetical protein [Prevotellaceae bacterium]